MYVYHTLQKTISSACCGVGSMASLVHEDHSHKYSSCLAPQQSPVLCHLLLTVYSSCRRTFLCLSFFLMPPRIIYSRESLAEKSFPTAKQQQVWEADVFLSAFTYRSTGALKGYANVDVTASHPFTQFSHQCLQINSPYALWSWIFKMMGFFFTPLILTLEIRKKSPAHCPLHLPLSLLTATFRHLDLFQVILQDNGWGLF